MKIKAYAWDDEDCGESYFVWTTTPGKAKALLASEHDREFTEMRVYRVPWADKYSESKIIPAKELLSKGKMKIEDLKVGRVYRAKRPRVVHTLGGSYINDRQILYISPFKDINNEK